MNELGLQKMVADVVIASGGAAMKLNNEYIKGPSDLLFKLPDRPAFFLEAKRTHFGLKTMGLRHFTWQWDVTQLQKNFMRDWDRAGMKCGVLSFVHLTKGNITSLRIATYTYRDCVEHQWTASLADHVDVGDHKTRNSNIMALLKVHVEIP